LSVELIVSESSSVQAGERSTFVCEWRALDGCTRQVWRSLQSSTPAQKPWLVAELRRGLRFGPGLRRGGQCRPPEHDVLWSSVGARGCVAPQWTGTPWKNSFYSKTHENKCSHGQEDTGLYFPLPSPQVSQRMFVFAHPIVSLRLYKVCSGRHNAVISSWCVKMKKT